MRNGRKKTDARRGATTARFERPGPTPTTFTGRPVFGAFVPFAAETVVQPDGWIVLAYAVAMKTSKVTLARQDFEDCVRNFAAYPCCPVTIEHADTADDPFGALPKEWKEPSGHIEELRVGEMTRTVGGQPVVVATLEGRPSYEASVANDVGAKKKWRFGSITILQGAVDEETGQKLGSMLWSWSLTAHPRLTGLPAIAASKKIPAEGEVVQAGYWWGDIDTREDLLECIKTVLDLPVTYTEAETLAELDKLESLVTDPNADTTGIDLDYIVRQFRDALRLPALKTKTEVIAEVRKGLTTLPSEVTPATDTSMSHRGAAARNTEKIMFKFLPFAALLGLVAATEEDAEKKVTTFAQLGADAIKALGLPVTCTAAELGARVKELTDAAGKLPGLEKELTAFRDERAKAEKALRASWIDDVIAEKPELKAMRASLELHAAHDWKGFAETYPRPDREKLITAAAEQAQRAQDGARTQGVTAVTASANPTTKDAPKPEATPKTVAQHAAEIRETYAQFSVQLSITDAIEMAQSGETAEKALAWLKSQTATA